MKIVETYPPNYDLIVSALGDTGRAIFCYGDTLYNPTKRPISPDIEFHEEIHSRQQGDHPDAWYAQYLTDGAFRLAQEIEAYGEQYLFAKQHVKETKLIRWALESMALALSGKEYGSLISYGAAESKIRNYGK